MNAVDYRNMSTEELKAEEARLSLMLQLGEAGTHASPEAAIGVQPGGMQGAPDPGLQDDDGNETVYLENRINKVMECAPEVRTVLVSRDDVPEFGSLLQQYSEAAADATIANTNALDAVMKADEARRSLAGLGAKIEAAAKEVEMARQELEAALDRLVSLEEARRATLAKVRLAKEAEARADMAAFNCMIIAGKANRCLIDSELGTAERAFKGAMRKIEGLRDVPDEARGSSGPFMAPYAFRSPAGTNPDEQ
jgi:hypothetical protein